MPDHAPLLHLDTNHLIRLFVEGSPEKARADEWAERDGRLGVSSVAWSEYLCGPLPAGEEAAARKLLPEAEPLTRVDAELAARLFNDTGRRSRSLADCQIAATAIRCGAALATSNLADFRPFVPFGLRLA